MEWSVCVSPSQPLLHLQVVYFVGALVTRIEKSIPKMMLWQREESENELEEISRRLRVDQK